MRWPNEKETGEENRDALRGAFVSLLFQDALAGLGRLSAGKLDKTSRRIRKNLADAEWKMGLCLLAMVRTGGFRTLGYATISEYGEKVLSLSGKKLSWLLGTAKALEHLPLLSQAFKKGEIGWGKVRALQSLATPETEREWLDFALTNSTDAVSKKVAMSPTQWKRHRALEASLRKKPVATVQAVKAVLSESVRTSEKSVSLRSAASERGPTETGGAQAADAGAVLRCGAEGGLVLKPGMVSKSEAETQARTPMIDETANAAHPSTPAARHPGKIRLVIDLTPDQYALYEAAERRVRAQAGKRVARGDVVARMAEKVLDEGTARARLRHQVLIHTCDNCRSAWYETDQGVHPVNSQVLEDTLRKSKPLTVETLAADADSEGHGSKCCPCDSERVEQAAPPTNAAGANETAVHLPNKESSTGQQHGRELSAPSQQNPPRDSKPRPLSVGREYIPNSTLRALFARAGNCCERCGARGALLEVHHVVPVSEGGGHALDELRLYCRACHTLHHQKDLHEKPGWRRARQMAMGELEPGRRLEVAANIGEATAESSGFQPAGLGESTPVSFK